MPRSKAQGIAKLVNLEGNIVRSKVADVSFDSDQVVTIVSENLPVDQTGFDSDQVVAIINENSSGGGGLGDYGAVNSTGTAASATGTDAIAIGENAVANGTDTVAIGRLSGSSNSQTITAVGAQALRNNSGGAGNTAVGYSAGYSSGRESVFIGMSAGQGNQSTVYGNTYLGYQAGLADTGGYNIAIGHKANGYSSGSSASYQIYIGGGAGGGRTVPAGGMNRNGTIGIGLEAGAQSGAFNQSPSSYDGPIFIGNFVGSRVQGQNNYNVGIGTCSFHPQGGSNQVNYSYCVGIGGLNYTSTSATSGTSYCVAVGHKANELLQSGANQNTSIGALAGKNTTTGTNNTFIGYNAGYNCTTNGSNIAIGTTNLGGNYSGSIVIGNSLTSKGNNTAYIGGSSSIYNQVNTSSWQTVSDERIKKNITEYSNGLNKLDLVNVKTYNYKPDSEIATDSPELTDSDGNVNLSLNTEKTVVGLIAQELETVLPNSVLTAENGIKSIDTDELFWVMLNSIKELKARVEALENA